MCVHPDPISSRPDRRLTRTTVCLAALFVALSMTRVNAAQVSPGTLSGVDHVRPEFGGPLPFIVRPDVPSAPSFDVVVVARSGDEPPERPGEVFTSFSDPAVDDAGRVVFKGNFDGPLSGNEGLYLFDAPGGTLVRLVDDSFDFSPPGQSGASSWTSFSLPTLNAQGHAAFRGNFSFGDNSQGLYVHDGASVRLVFDDNPLQPVPGQPTAMGFNTFPMGAGVLPLLADSGHAATVAHWSDASFTDRQGLYLGLPGGSLVRVADETQTPPGQGPSASFSDFDSFASMNASGDVAFHAQYSGGLGGHGVYRYERASGQLRRLADGRVRPPGQALGTAFSTLDGFVSMNATGDVAFHGTYSGGLGNDGLYRGDGFAPLEVVVDDSGSHPVPGHPSQDFNAFGFPVINAPGDVVFSASFGPGGSNAGLFLAGTGGLANLIELGDVVPGQVGASFFAFGSPSVNAAGHVALTGRYSGGSGDEGVYFLADGGVFAVLDESDTPGGLSITNLHLLVTTGGAASHDGKPGALNLGDGIAFRASLAGGEEAILLATRR